MPPSLTIVVPCYNSERYIRTTIESILAQTVAPDEIILSDDRSPDSSFAILQEYEGVRNIRVTRPPARTSLGGHYRFLLEEATSDYVSFLSSDDVLMPNFVETMRGMLEDDLSVSLIAGAAVDTDSALKPLQIEGAGRSKETLVPPAGFDYFTGGCLYKISFAVLSRKILAAVPALPLDADLGTDWCWALLLGARGKVKFVTTPMGYYRIHATNAGHNAGDRWRRACVNMLRFVQAQVDSGDARKLDRMIAQMDAEIVRTAQGLPDEVSAPGMKDRAKALVKRVMALRYGSLSRQIKLAEQGIGVSLPPR